jgi:thiamine kinase-like enzyme
MTGLRARDRDRHLPARMGDGELVPPTELEILRLVSELMLAPEAEPPVEITQVHARWKLGVAAATCYAVRWADGHERWVTWKKHLSGKARRHEASLAARPWRAALEHRLRPAVLLADGAQLVAFPRDRVLRGLERALDDKRTIRWIKELDLFAPDDVRRRRSRFEPLRYKPERRAVMVAHLSLKGPEGQRSTRRIGVRVLEPEEARKVVEARALLGDAEGPRTPRLLGVDDEAGILLEEWVEGRPLAGDALEAAPRVGRALALLHRRGCGELEASAPSPDLSLLARLDPDLHEEAVRLLTSVPPSRALCLIHGDQHAGQWLETPEGELVLLDLDALRGGEAEEDVADWLMDLHLEGGPTSRARDLLLEAYAEAGGRPLSSRRIDQLLLRACIVRAANTLRRMEEGAEACARALLDDARRLEHLARLTPVGSLGIPIPEGVDGQAVIRAEAQKSGRLVLEVEAPSGRTFHGRPLDGEWEPLRFEDDEALPGRTALGEGELLAWRPGRRAAWRSADRSRAVKAVRPKKLDVLLDRFARCAAAAEQAATLRVPEVLGADRREGLVEFAWSTGSALELGHTAAWRAVGKATAELQRLVPHHDLPRHGPEDELQVIETLGMRQALAGLDLPLGIERVHVDLTDMLPAVPVWTAAHRDLHDGQLLQTADGSILLLDLDLLSAGAPELDLGNLGVHLVLRAWQGRGSVEEAWSARAALLEGHEAAGGRLDPVALEFYERSTALRLALVYRMRPRWVGLVPGLMDLARGGLRKEVCLA